MNGGHNSTEIVEIVKALNLAQGEMSLALKDTNNPFFKSKYADLASMWEVYREPLAKNGLALTHTTDIVEGGEIILKTILMHTSGQWIKSVFPLRPVTPTPQGYGACITYARRQCVSALLGIVTDDDDGNQASGNGRPVNKQEARPQHKQQPQGQAQGKPVSAEGGGVITANQVGYLVQSLKGMDDIRGKVEKNLTDKGILSFEEMPVSLFESIMKYVLAEKAKLAKGGNNETV